MASVKHKEKYSVVYGQKTINFSLLFCDRKTMEIAVYPDCAVIVKAPEQSELSVIKKKVYKRARWILRQLNYFNQFHPQTPDRCYVNGETHLYLGRQYRLKIIKGSENSVKLTRGYFHIIIRNGNNPEQAEKLLTQWYLEKAQKKFKEVLERNWLKFKHLNVLKPTLSIKRMEKRWGSLSSKGTLTLNTRLIKASIVCIDYVVIHELCHLIEPNHSPDYYKLLSTMMPNWENHKLKLERTLS